MPAIASIASSTSPTVAAPAAPAADASAASRRPRSIHATPESSDRGLAEAPQCDRGDHDRKLQHGRRRGREPEAQVGVLEEAHREHRERRRVRGAEDQRDVDHRQREREHCVHRQPQLRVELRHDHLEPRRRATIAQGPRHGERLLRTHLVERADRHQHEIRHFLRHEPQHQRGAGGMTHRGHVGRQVEPRRPRRQHAQDPARRRDQEREPQRQRRVRRREHRREPGTDSPRQRALPCPRAEAHREDERHERRGETGGDGETHAGREPRLRDELSPGVEARRGAAERRQDAERGQQRAEEPRPDRQRERGDGDPGRGSEPARAAPRRHLV